MSDFNDWCERQDIFNENIANQDCRWALKFMRQSFEAGQQSQQAKIDELQKLRSLDEVAINQLAQANQVWQIKCDELQARVNDAEKWIESNRKTIALEYSGYTTEEYVDADEMMNILKWSKDETII